MSVVLCFRTTQNQRERWSCLGPPDRIPRNGYHVGSDGREIISFLHRHTMDQVIPLEEHKLRFSLVFLHLTRSLARATLT